jgi:pilus assembly protein CpaC
MKLRNLFTAGLLGLSIGAASIAPTYAQSTLKVMRGATSNSIKVSVNRAIVMESEESFAELSVANAGIADIATLSDRTIYVLGKKPGRTTLTLLGADGRLITNVDVQVTPDLAEFKERLREIMPKEKIEIRTAGGGIVLSGRISSKRKLSRALELASRYAGDAVTNLMVVGGSNQVMLKVRFAEMSRSVSKGLNGSLGLSSTSGGNSVGASTGTVLANDSTRPYEVATGVLGAAVFGLTSGGLAIDVLLEALETKGMVRTLAEPNLVALSGQEASFLAGGEVPVPVSTGDGTTVTYKQFGISLKFLPTVIDNDLINLVLDVSVSAPDASSTSVVNGVATVGFATKQTTTVVEIKDGQSLAIAGLLEDNFMDAVGQVPWLGDIPVLGALFRSSSYSRDQTELVIIVTPHLVSPVDGDSLTLPTDRVRLPSERDLFLMGKTSRAKNKAAPAAGSVASQDFSGSYGYVLE